METQKAVKRIAEITLDELEHLDDHPSADPPTSKDVFAYPAQKITGESAGEKNLGRIQSTLYSDYTEFKRTPFIAYAKANVDNNLKEYFFTRNAIPRGLNPLKSGVQFVNYKSPMGRIVELEVNDDDIINVPSGEKEVLLLEKNLFKSIKEKNQWDGIQNSIFTDGQVFTIPSLLKFLKDINTIIHDVKDLKLDIQESERIINEKAEEKFREITGLQRQVIEKMELRDQPVLDQKQGEIFRLPLASQIIITGAPGTGKTTTLIKRIAQKINPEFLESDEKKKIQPERIEEFIHPDNWVMFTPTELLKMFVKEALNKESVAASDRRVKVWEDERDRIAREILGILKTGDKGYFRKSREKILPQETNTFLIEYALRFEAFYIKYLFEIFEKARKILNENGTAGKLITNFNRIEAKLKEPAEKNLDTKAFSLIDELKKNRDLFNRMNQELKQKIETLVLGFCEKLDDSINDLYELILAYRSEKIEETDIDEEFSNEDEMFEPETDEQRIILKRQLTKTIRYIAQRIANGRNVPKNTLHGRLYESLEFYLPNKGDMIELGKRIIDMKVSNILTRGHTNLLGRISYYYQKFRLSLTEKDEIKSNAFDRATKEKKISGSEIDLLIFIILKNARKIFDQNTELLEINSKVEILESIKDQYITQVVVDEATDFSTLQLGCMYNLSHPLFNSVSFSGDLMQRVTLSGLNRWEECHIISPNINIYQVEKVYRQSPKLLKIAEILYENNVGQKAPFHSAYLERGNEPEALKFDMNIEVDVGQWISDRIVEIYQIHGGRLPSIAIFVAQDDQINPAIDKIQESLEDNSISIKGCPGGEIFGSEGKVRVFSIKYIKGLEFESVFFLNINNIAIDHPELFDKYIYVGLTRAASFMGVTYEKEFPSRIKNVEPFFKNSTWQHIATGQ